MAGSVRKSVGVGIGIGGVGGVNRHMNQQLNIQEPAEWTIDPVEHSQIPDQMSSTHTLVVGGASSKSGRYSSQGGRASK